MRAYQQGQRDREQGWPVLLGMWGFTGETARAYLRGYAKPRVEVR